MNKTIFKLLIIFVLSFWNLVLIALYFLYNNIEGYAISDKGNYVVDISNIIYFYSSDNFVTASMSFSEGVRIIPTKDSESVWIYKDRSRQLVEYDYNGNELSIENDAIRIMFPYPDVIVNGDYYIKHQNIGGYEKLVVGQISVSNEIELDFCKSAFIKKVVLFGAFLLFGNITGVIVYFMMSKSLK